MKIEEYDCREVLFSFPNGVEVWSGESEKDNGPVLILCFPHSEAIASDAYNHAKSIIMQLRNEPLLLPVLETYFNKDKYAFCVVYEMLHSFKWLPLEINSGEIEKENILWIMHATTKILASFYETRLYGQFIGTPAIFADKENFSIRLGFFGLSKLFQAHHAVSWNNKQSRLNEFDDIEQLIDCFKYYLPKKIDYLKDANEKLRDYPALLRIMAKDIRFRPFYKNTIHLFFNKTIDDSQIEEFVEHLQLNDCYVSEWEEEKSQGKQRRKCRFQTKKFEGVFINDEGDEHYFIPRSSRVWWNVSSPRGNILRAIFKHTNDTVRGQPSEHHLSTLVSEKENTVKEWRIVPKNEKEFIEESAFKSNYLYSREIESSSIKKFAFLLREHDETDWQKMESLKEKEKRLDAVPMYVKHHDDERDVGMFEDFTKPRLIICVKSDRGDIPKEGTLLIDKEILKFEFKWRTRGKMYFASPKNSDVEEKQKIIEEKISPVVTIQEISGNLGKLLNVYISREIITRDMKPDAKLPHSPGTLHEDIKQEIIPLKRQIDAVNQFQKDDMIEPLLGGILATPSEHKPLFIPPKELTLFNTKLNESQQNAVKGALFQKPLFLIHGPPGTGKTTVIVEIIRQILANDKHARILVCSQTNLAVDNVIERLPEEQGKIRKIRLALSQRKIAQQVHPHWFDRRLKTWVEKTIEKSQTTAKKFTKKVHPKSDFGRAVENALRGVENTNKKSDTPQSDKQEKNISNIIEKWEVFLHDDDAQTRSNVEGGWLPLKIAFLKSMNVIGATCVHIASRRYSEIFRDSYDCMIMDEASKATPAQSLIPIVRAKQIVLIGDHKQLPPFVPAEREIWNKVQGKSQELEDMGHEDLRRHFGTSLFEELIIHFSNKKDESVQVMLNTQRRMPKQVGDLISEYFYEGKLQSPEDDKYACEKRIGLPFKKQTGLVLINTAQRKKCHDNGSANWRQNSCNADVVKETLFCLNKHLPKADIAVIAGYRGQVDLLKKKIKKIYKNKEITPEVNTVDGFQGRENDIVIYDIVRSSGGEDTIGFLDEPRRLNVALSRAKKLLVIVGNADFLINHALPSKERQQQGETMSILGGIAKKIEQSGLIFNSMEDSLKK